MKNLYLPNYQKILLFCVLLLCSQLSFGQTLDDPTGLTPGGVFCVDEPITLTGSCTGGASLKWYEDALSTAEITTLTFNITETVTYFAVCVSSCTCEMSNSVPVTFTVNKPLNFTRNQIICDGSSIALTASCPRGTPAWYIGDTDTSVGTNTTVSPTIDTDYFVRCEDGSCDNPFEQITIGVSDPGNQLTAPIASGATICAGTTYTFSATCATGTPFYFENDGTTEILTADVRPTVSPTTYKIRCEDGTNCSSDFTPIQIILDPLPVPNVTTASGPVCRGASVDLIASCASGSSVQWYNADGSTMLAGTTVTPSATTTYKVRCENNTDSECVSEFESVTLTTTYAITTEPESVLTCVDDEAVFTVAATSATGYQWQKKQTDGTYTNISLATSSTLTISTTTLTDRGYYRCQVLTATCSFYSEEAFLGFPQAIISKSKLAPTGVSDTDEYGSSVAVSNGYAIVGAPGKTAISSFAKGAAYIYKMGSDGKWSQAATLTSNDLDYGDFFGTSVAISGDYAFVGAPYQDSDNGAVYIFKRQTNNTWLKVDKLLDTVTPDEFGLFGAVVSVSGDYLAVGQPYSEKVYTFKKNNAGTWVLTQEIDGTTSSPSPSFASSIGISENTLAVGSPGDGSGGEGAVVIYERDNAGVWQLKDKLIPTDIGLDFGFGISLAIGGNTMIASSVSSSSLGFTVRLYERNGAGTWEQKDGLTSADVDSDGGFGFSLSVHDNIAVVGALLNSNFKGAAVVFERNTAGIWEQKEFIMPEDLNEGDGFGGDVVTDGNTLIIGSSLAAFSSLPPGVGNKGAASFYQLYTSPAVAVGAVSQVSGVCSGQKAIFNLTGLSGTEPYTITYKIDTAGTEKTIVVTPDASGNASFTETLLLANNTKNIYLTKIKNNVSNCEKVINVTGEIAVKLPTEITSPPILQTVCVGETAVFFAEATGEGILTFQWQRQAPVTSATGGPLNNDFADISVLTLPSRPLSDNGAKYRVKVTGECGVAISAEALLTVLPKASASISTGGPICPGTAGSLVFAGTPNAQVFYTSNGSTTSIILDGDGAAVVSTGILTEETAYNLVSINIGGKCDQVLSGSAKVEILATGTNPPLVLTSPANDVLANGVQAQTAQTIQASIKIESSAKVTHIGNNYVLMKPGFEAKQGSVYTAKITGACI